MQFARTAACCVVYLGETNSNVWACSLQRVPFTTDAELLIQTMQDLQPSAKLQGAEPAPFRTNDLFDCVQSHIAVPYEEDVTVRCVFVFGRSHQIPVVNSNHPLLHKPVRLPCLRFADLQATCGLTGKVDCLCRFR